MIIRFDSISTVTETVSNKLIFNILTTRGFISLTDYSGIGSFEENGDDDSNGGTSGLDYSDSYIFKEPSAGNGVFDADDGKVLFPLGRTVITDGANAVLNNDDITGALHSHQTGNFGTVSSSDQKANHAAIKNGGRILSAYRSASGEAFWIITEHDRSVTTVLLPEEY